MKDKRLIKNWRPISLINMDAEIASKAPAKRWEKTPPKSPEIIHFNQNAFVKERTMSMRSGQQKTWQRTFKLKQKGLSGILLTVMLPPLYQQCFDACVNNKVTLQFQGIVNEIIWKNKFLCVNKKSVFRRDLFFPLAYRKQRTYFRVTMQQYLALRIYFSILSKVFL